MTERKTTTTRTLLNKQSNEMQIKAYFEGVQRLYQSGEPYPVNLDDVWMLIYAAKNKAVRALKRDFIEGDDYTTVPISGQGGQFTRIDYKLTVSCFEYLIAKKVRSIFDVYRQVFKKVATGEVRVTAGTTTEIMTAPKSSAELMLMYAQQMVEQERKIVAIEHKANEQEQRLHEIEQRINGTVPYTTIIGFGNRYGLRIPREKACALGRVATNLCKKYGFEMGQVQDPRFGWVKTYPDGVLSETYQKYYPNITF